MVLDVHPPHLLFLGDIKNPLDAKTAMGVLEWRPEHCIGQFRLPGCEIDLGLPDLSPTEAFDAGAKSLLIGVAPLGGEIAPEWMESIRLSLASGLSVVSGLHQKLTAVNGLKSIADAKKVALVDVRVPPDVHRIALGKKRAGKRLLTVGTDCCVGKKYTALAVWKALAKQGVDVTFRATGQTGIMISGSGIPVDAVVSDFLPGVCEYLTPDAGENHWDIIEGQGSLFHPAYAAVTLGLMHGSQPDLMLLCHDPNRVAIDGFESFPIPAISDSIRRYEEAARLTNPVARVAGISLNTAGINKEKSDRICAEVAESTGLPCFDPLKTSIDALVLDLIS
tara:strand:- start:73 stop:1080 length:1008 start_codon:yes stop_codon:yes gene_type:complete